MMCFVVLYWVMSLVILHYVVLCCALVYWLFVVLYRVISCYDLLCCSVLYHVMICCVVECYIVL